MRSQRALSITMPLATLLAPSLRSARRAAQRWVAVLGAVAAVLVVAHPSAQAQMDITGEWAPLFHEDQIDRVPGLGPVDFTGLPLTEGARQWALSWDASRVSVIEHQCQVHVLPYILSGPTRLRIRAEQDTNTQRIVSFRQYIGLWGQERTIWVDGRPHPPDIAPHTWMGFSTGHWEGNTFVVKTTHIKQGWLRRNGVPESDLATTTERFSRHGEILTYVIYIRDPVYLTEPLVRSRNFVRMQGLAEGNWIAATPCEPAEETVGERHAVPNYLPGTNPFATEAAERTGLPADVLLGGADGMYPEYQLKLEAAKARSK
jgi:hypothetical protein